MTTTFECESLDEYVVDSDWRPSQDYLDWFQSEDRTKYVLSVCSFFDRQLSQDIEACDHVDPKGFVYFIKDVDRNLIKIGFSINVFKRLKELETGNAGNLVLLKKIKGTTKDEARLHRRFSHLRTRLEWFIVAEELTQFIAMLESDKTLDVFLSDGNMQMSLDIAI